MKPYKTPKRLLLIALLLICATTTTLHCQTTLYNQYKHRTDIRVACIMQYPITDSVKVDVTLFIPKTKEAVWPMVEEFNVINLEKDSVNYYYSNDKYAPLHFYNVEKDNIKRFYGPIRNPDNDYKNMAYLVYSYKNGVLMIFHDIETEQRSDILEQFLIGTLKQPDLLPKINEEK